MRATARERETHLPDAPARVAEILGELRRREDALRLEEQEIARLRTSATHAAERQAAVILRTAREDIRRIVLDARSELLGLLECLQIVTASGVDSRTGQKSASESASFPVLVEARKSVRDILGEARVGLEKLEDDARVAGFDVPANTEPEPARSEPPRDSRADQSVQQPAPHGPEPDRRSRRWKVFASLLIVVGLGALVMAFGAALSFRVGQPASLPANPSDGSTALSPLPSKSVHVRAAVVAPAPTPETSFRRRESTASVERIVGASAPPRERAQGISGAAQRAGVEAIAGAALVQRESVEQFSGGAAAPQDGELIPGASGPRPGPREVRGSVARAEALAASGAGSGGARASADTDETRAALTTAVPRWLDAYYRQGPAALQGITVSDSRRSQERPPAGLANVRRTLDRVSFQFTGDAAIVTARVTEESDSVGQARKYLSWVSQLWLLESNKWRLIDMRLVADAQPK